MKLALCHPSGTCNLAVVPRFVENLCTPVISMKYFVYYSDHFYCLISKKEMCIYQHLFVEHYQRILDLTTDIAPNALEIFTKYYCSRLWMVSPSSYQ